MARNIDYAKIPMGKNDIGAKTIGEYFEQLLLTLWDEQEGFSGKRPFGNSGWEYDVYASLISAGVVDGSLDEEGYVDQVTYSAANNIICEMIEQIFAISTADVVPKSEVAKEFTCFVGDPHKVERCPYLDEIEKAKTEFAREIFEEIEKILKCNHICSVLGDIAELKKKYTEGNEDE